MPRVHVKRKNRAGATRSCGRCAREILPGENYRSWSFRYGGTHFRCFRKSCAPRRSELTQSKLSEIFGAMESAETAILEADTVEEIKEAIEEVEASADQVADEYEEASEPFGYQGEHAERAEEVREFGEELANFYPEEDDDIDVVREDAQQILDECPL